MLYFFDVRDGAGYTDNDGTELPSLEAARLHATKYAGELLQSSPSTLWSGTPWAMDVKDHHGLTILNLKFVGTDAVTASDDRVGDVGSRDLERAKRD